MDSTVELSFQSESLLKSTDAFNIPKRDSDGELAVSVENAESTKCKKSWNTFCLKIFAMTIIIGIAIYLLYNLISLLKIESNKNDNRNEKKVDEDQYIFEEYRNQECGRNKISPNLNPNSLGRSLSKRIIGGEDAIANSWPWMVSIRLKADKTNNVCGGSLVRDDLVITAAHCLMIVIHASRHNVTNLFSTVEVHVGAHNQKSSGFTDDNVYDILYFEIHDKYEQVPSLRNDIGLIKLKRKVNLSRPEVALICLPDLKLKNEQVNNGDDLLVVGWGTYAEEYTRSKFTPENLRQVILTALDSMSLECNSGEKGKNWDQTNIICAHSNEKNKKSGTCTGDSGGPVVMYRNNRWILVGIVSYGDFIKDEHSNARKCDASRPSYFVKVSSYLDYIQGRKNKKT